MHVISEPQELPLLFGMSNQLTWQGIPIRNPHKDECLADLPNLLWVPFRIGVDRPLPFLVQDPGLFSSSAGAAETVWVGAR